jgi:predicted kinase
MPYFEEGLYTPEWTERTCSECLRRAEDFLLNGERVIVDASFRGENERTRFLKLAARMGVEAVFLLCEAESVVVQARIRDRQGDASDADWSVYRKAAAAWEKPDQRTLKVTRVISTGNSEEHVLFQAIEALRTFGLES